MKNSMKNENQYSFTTTLDDPFIDRVLAEVPEEVNFISVESEDRRYPQVFRGLYIRSMFLIDRADLDGKKILGEKFYTSWGISITKNWRVRFATSQADLDAALKVLRTPYKPIKVTVTYG